VHIKLYEAIPVRTFVCGTMEADDGQDYYFAVLRLPSYQLMPSWRMDRDEWHQLAIRFHGKHGFDMQWLPCEPPTH
jgi:hypothetical protein